LLPQYASCSFDPATETVNSGVTGNVILNLSTSDSAIARVEPAAGWGAAPLLCGLVLLPFAFARRRRVLLLAVLACALAAGITACTSSGGGTGGSPPGQKQTTTTAPGTYSIPVTATTGGVSQPVTLTLTVD
jgi:hypothetical protein